MSALVCCFVEFRTCSTHTTRTYTRRFPLFYFVPEAIPVAIQLIAYTARLRGTETGGGVAGESCVRAHVCVYLFTRCCAGGPSFYGSLVDSSLHVHHHSAVCSFLFVLCCVPILSFCVSQLVEHRHTKSLEAVAQDSGSHSRAHLHTPSLSPSLSQSHGSSARASFGHRDRISALPPPSFSFALDGGTQSDRGGVRVSGRQRHEDGSATELEQSYSSLSADMTSIQQGGSARPLTPFD